MRVSQESSADRIWKEKLDSCASPSEAIALLILLAALAAGLLVS